MLQSGQTNKKKYLHIIILAQVEVLSPPILPGLTQESGTNLDS